MKRFALRAALTFAVVCSAVSATAFGATPKQYYLALGDSIAYGIQPDKVAAGLPPSGFRTGYVDLVAARLRRSTPKIRVVNYGCPGESTVTFSRGGCPWLAGGKRLHDPFKGSQLRAALVFLRAHRNQVSPITLTLWGNDVTALSDACKGKLACIGVRAPRALAAFASRLGSILGQLRAAAPKAQIIVTGAWNGEAQSLAATNALYRSLDATIRQTAARAKVRFADTLPAFNPHGSIAGEHARICAFTFICSRGDGHPTDTGYRAIATAVLAASR